MTLTRAALSASLLLASFAAMSSACNTGLGDCPDSKTMSNGGACPDNNLDCPYTLESPKSCKGIVTSCVCTSGAWACPTPTDCTPSGAH